MFDIKMYRERFEKYPSLPILITMVLMGSVLFGFSSDEVDVVRSVGRFPRDSGLESCQENLAGSSFLKCSDFCYTLQKRLNNPQPRSSWRTTNTVLLCLLIVTIPTSIAFIIILLRRAKPKKSNVITVYPKPLVPSEDVVQNPKDKQKSSSIPVAEASCISLTGDTAADKFSLEDVAIPSTLSGSSSSVASGVSAAQIGLKGRPETPDEIKVRMHGEKRRQQHKEDANSRKFQKKGPIYIPREPLIPPAAVLPDNIILDTANFNADYNEMYDIGSNVDDIELEPSTLHDLSKSDSKTEKKTKKNNTKTTEPSEKSKTSKNEQKKKKNSKSEKSKKEPKKKSNETAPQKKPSKEGVAEKKASQETLVPEKKPSKENNSEKKTPEKKVSKESVPEQQEKKDEEI